MFDLAVLDGAMGRSERVRHRLEDERRLFGVVVGRARRRVLLACADTHPDADELSARTRFADEIDGLRWAPAPGGPFDEPVSVREAAAAWRRSLADSASPAWRRLAALDGLVALGVDPSRWWFQRDWTDPGTPLHEEVRVSYSRLSNLESCELFHVLGDELGLGHTPLATTPGSARPSTGSSRRWRRGRSRRTRSPSSRRSTIAGARRSSRRSRSPTAFHKLAREHMLRNWFETYGEHPALAIEQRFDFEFEGATITGYIDRIGAHLAKDGFVITDFKTGKADKAGPPAENLQLGIYYLAVQESEDLAAFRPVREVELAFLRGDWRDTRHPAPQVAHQRTRRGVADRHARAPHRVDRPRA